MAKGGPIRSHHTDTVDRDWSGPTAERRLEGRRRELRRAHAWVEPGDDDQGTKGAYKFIHHEVTGDGTVGPANVKACISGIGVLNGGRGGSDIPASDRQGVYRHLATHLKDAGREPPELER